jgi:hypothetical protein
MTTYFRMVRKDEGGVRNKVAYFIRVSEGEKDVRNTITYLRGCQKPGRVCPKISETRSRVSGDVRNTVAYF